MIILTSRSVLLPEFDAPQPATMVIDKSSGTIIEIYNDYRHQEIGFLKEKTGKEWLDLGDKVILPGLVECAGFVNHIGYV